MKKVMALAFALGLVAVGAVAHADDDDDAAASGQVKIDATGVHVQGADGGNVDVTDGAVHVQGTTTHVDVNHGGDATGAGPVITINDNKVHQTVECKGGEMIVVNGNHAQLRLKGDCGTLSVNGNHNKIAADHVATITANGNHNDISWRNGRDESTAALVTSNGKQNRIRQLKAHGK